MRDLDFSRCKYNTPGLRALRKIDASNTEVAEKLAGSGQRVNQSTVSRWRSGESRPGDGHKKWLRIVFNISEDSWDLPHERRAERKLAASVAKGAA